jgi:fumarate hydratase class II
LWGAQTQRSLTNFPIGVGREAARKLGFLTRGHPLGGGR